MSDVYESSKQLSEYLLFHYGTLEEILPWPMGPRESLGFPVRTVGHIESRQGGRCLDVGCAVGRSSFEMSRWADEVIGIDFSSNFIGAARSIGKQESLNYERIDEVPSSSSLIARLPQGVNPDRVHFEQGDAMALRSDLGVFDVVHAANLVCRLPRPLAFLKRLPGLVKSGGRLVLATPCTWLEEFTPRSEWPGGDTLQWLRAAIGDDFELLRTADEPFLIREHVRKFQWSVSLVSVWQRH